MGKDLKVVNNSPHKLKVVGSYGNNFNNLAVNKEIGPGSSAIVGNITVPKGTHIPGFGGGSDIGTNNWGWIYLEDSVNSAQYELFCFVGCTWHVPNRVSIGYKTNQHNPDDATPNKERDGYLQAGEDSSGFVYTIKEMPADSYIFRLGKYTLNVAHRNINIGPFHGEIAAADHTFVIVAKYDGSDSWYFDCYGGHGTNSDEKANLCNVVVVCRGDKDALRRAKTICAFNPNVKPDIEQKTGDKYFPHNFKDDGGFTEAKTNVKNGGLFLGNCSGLIYARTGVCHQMANRIFTAASNCQNTDVLGWADVAFGHFTRTLFGPHGASSDIIGDNSLCEQTLQALFIAALLTLVPIAPPGTPQIAVAVEAFLGKLAYKELRDLVIKVIRMAWPDIISDEALKTMEKQPPVPEEYTWDQYFHACQTRLN